MSTKGDILQAIKTRLQTITQANGYSTDVVQVYADKIPMGIQLQAHEVPCIFVLDGPDDYTGKHDCMNVDWNVRMQLWHAGDLPDSTMIEFARNVLKAIYANHPSANVIDAFRALHPKVYEVVPLQNSPDLNMIEANRVTELSFIFRYRTSVNDL